MTLRELAAEIQRKMPERVAWWNGLTTAQRKQQLKQVNDAAKPPKKRKLTKAQKRSAARSENEDAFTRQGRMSQADWRATFNHSP